MASNEWPNSRFLFPDMFSFSFDPEILTFLWGLCARKSDDGQLDYRSMLPKSSLLQVFVPFESDPLQHTNFFTFLRYTVVTGGVLMAATLTSYSTFRVLQKLRCEGFNGLKSSVLSFFRNVFQAPKRLKPVRTLELVLRRRHSNTTNDIRKRPSDLLLTGPINGPNTAEAVLRNRLNGNTNSVPTNPLIVTPVSMEIASGEEDVEELQSQYFGPISKEVNTPQRTEAAFVMSPISPNSTLRTRYESHHKPSAGDETPTNFVL